MTLENGEESKVNTYTYKKPMELFDEKEVVKICAPMVRYSKLSSCSTHYDVEALLRILSYHLIDEAH